MPKGLLFGPDLRRLDRPDLPPKFKKTKKKTKRKVTSRSKGESRSKVQRDRKREERKKKREDRLQRREEEKQRQAEIGEPVVTKVKAKRVFKSNHGAEQVDATILKLLGKTQKSKKVGPRRRVAKPEVAVPKWRHGMREERHESRSVKAKSPKKTSVTEKMREKIRSASEEKMRRAGEKRKAKADASGEIVISSEQQNPSFSRKKSKAKADVSEEIVISSEQQTQSFSRKKIDVHQVVPTVNIGPDFEADRLDWAVEKQCKLVPIVDVGPDYEAEGGLCGSGVGASELAWPLPIQAPLEPMPPCMAFYQVRRQ